MDRRYLGDFRAYKNELANVWKGYNDIGYLSIGPTVIFGVSGIVQMEKAERRPLPYEAKWLHLNKGKSALTLLVDLYWVGLIYLILFVWFPTH